MNTVSNYLSALREAMKAQGLDALVIPSADPHLSEYLPAHWQARRELTADVEEGIVVVRGTGRTIPKGALPDRRNVVLPAQPELQCPGCLMVHSMDEALEVCRTADEAFIIGGREVYRQFLPVADRLCLTRVHHVFPEADVFFPDVDWSVWREAERTDHAPDERNPYALTFATYLRR